MNLFTQIHEIIFHGQGAYSWDVVYNMPIWLRKFTFHKLKTYYEKDKSDLAAQSENIKSGKVELPSHFKGKPGKNIPKY
jgi:hypothetical protein